MQLNNRKELEHFRKKLRNNATPAEVELWRHLKGRKLEGRKFRRQHSFGNCIMDFYCPSERLAIELDGQGHFEEEGMRRDAARDAFFAAYGIRVFRVENRFVFEALQDVLNGIVSEFGLTPPP